MQLKLALIFRKNDEKECETLIGRAVFTTEELAVKWLAGTLRGLECIAQEIEYMTDEIVADDDREFLQQVETHSDWFWMIEDKTLNSETNHDKETQETQETRAG